MKLIEGTKDDLRRLREAAEELRQAEATLADAALPGCAASVRRELAMILDIAVIVQVPCDVCQRGFPVVAVVNADSVPLLVICTECDERHSDGRGAEESGLAEGTGIAIDLRVPG